MSLTFSSIVPLIGGMTLGAMDALSRDPEWIASYKAFAYNDSQLLQNINPDIPYIVMDDPESNIGRVLANPVDIVTALTPCSALSMANCSANRGMGTASVNWTFLAAEFILSTMKPRAMIGENAPNLFTKAGTEVRNEINKIALKHGYTMQMIKTCTSLHGVPQKRSRSFFILWQGSDAYELDSISVKPHPTTLEWIRDVPLSGIPIRNFKEGEYDAMMWLMDILGLTFDELYKGKNTYSSMQQLHSNPSLMPEFEKMFGQYEKPAKWIHYVKASWNRGSGFFDNSIRVMTNLSRALMWKNAFNMVHPDGNRFLDQAELLKLMGFDPTFKITHTNKPFDGFNTIFQNVPRTTAAYWVGEVAEALKGNRDRYTPSGGNILFQRMGKSKLSLTY